jgi:hypothetical protein
MRFLFVVCFASVFLFGCAPTVQKIQPLQGDQQFAAPEKATWNPPGEQKTALLQLTTQQDRLDAYNARFMMCSTQMTPDLDPLISRYLTITEQKALLNHAQTTKTQWQNNGGFLSSVAQTPRTDVIARVGFQLYKPFYNIQKAEFTYEYQDGINLPVIVYFDILPQEIIEKDAAFANFFLLEA